MFMSKVGPLAQIDFDFQISRPSSSSAVSSAMRLSGPNASSCASAGWVATTQWCPVRCYGQAGCPDRSWHRIVVGDSPCLVGQMPGRRWSGYRLLGLCLPFQYQSLDQPCADYSTDLIQSQRLTADFHQHNSPIA